MNNSNQDLISINESKEILEITNKNKDKLEINILNKTIKKKKKYNKPNLSSLDNPFKKKKLINKINKENKNNMKIVLYKPINSFIIIPTLKLNNKEYNNSNKEYNNKKTIMKNKEEKNINTSSSKYLIDKITNKSNDYFIKKELISPLLKTNNNLINQLVDNEKYKNIKNNLFNSIEDNIIFNNINKKEEISKYQLIKNGNYQKTNIMINDDMNINNSTSHEINIIKDNKTIETNKNTESINKEKKDPNKEYLEYECTLRPNKQKTIEINHIKPPKKQEDYDLESDLFDNTNLNEENKLVKTEIEYDKFYVYANSKNVKNEQYLPLKYKLYFEIFDKNENENKKISIRKKCRFIINEIQLMNPKRDEFFKFLNDVNLLSLEEMEHFYKEEISNSLIHVCYFIYFYQKYLNNKLSQWRFNNNNEKIITNTSIMELLSIKQNEKLKGIKNEEIKKKQLDIYKSLKEIDFDFGSQSYESIFIDYNLKDCDITKYPNLLCLLFKIITFSMEKSILKTCIETIKTPKYKTEKGLRGIIASNLLTTLIPEADYKKLRFLIYKHGREFNEREFKDEIFKNFC